MIHGRLLPNSHPVAPNAEPKLRKEPPFITGYYHAKCFVQIVVMHLTFSFSHVLPMKKSIPAKEILLHGRLKEGEIPFLVVGRWKIRSILCKALINNHLFRIALLARVKATSE